MRARAAQPTALCPEHASPLPAAARTFFPPTHLPLPAHAGLRVDCRTRKAMTPLLFAAYGGALRACQAATVCCGGPCCTHARTHMQTPLHMPAGHTETVALLLKRKANPAAVNKKGQTVLQISKPEVGGSGAMGWLRGGSSSSSSGVVEARQLQALHVLRDFRAPVRTLVCTSSVPCQPHPPSCPRRPHPSHRLPRARARLPQVVPLIEEALAAAAAAAAQRPAQAGGAGGGGVKRERPGQRQKGGQAGGGEGAAEGATVAGEQQDREGGASGSGAHAEAGQAEAQVEQVQAQAPEEAAAGSGAQLPPNGVALGASAEAGGGGGGEAPAPLAADQLAEAPAAKKQRFMLSFSDDDE